MVVYGKRKKKYVLSESPISKEYDSAVYSVSGNSDVLVKIYEPEYRTSETEKLVMENANGKGGILDELPLDIVYYKGRFFGYLFEKSIPEPAVPEIPAEPSPVRYHKSTNKLLIFLICIAAAMGLSALTYFKIFDILEKVIGATYCHWNFDGIPMIIGGWVLMLIAYFKSKGTGITSVIIGMVAFILGAAMTFGVISLLVWVVALIVNFTIAILPTIIIVIIVIIIIKSLMNR